MFCVQEQKEKQYVNFVQFTLEYALILISGDSAPSGPDDQAWSDPSGQPQQRCYVGRLTSSHVVSRRRLTRLKLIKNPNLSMILAILGQAWLNPYWSLSTWQKERSWRLAWRPKVHTWKKLRTSRRLTTAHVEAYAVKTVKLHKQLMLIQNFLI